MFHSNPNQSTSDIDKELKDIIKKSLTPLKALPTKSNSRRADLSGIKAVLFDIYGTLLISGTGDISIAQERSNLFSVDSILKGQGFQILNPNINELHRELLNNHIKDFHREQKLQGNEFPEVNILDIWKGLLHEMNDNEEIIGDITAHEVQKISLKYELMVNPVWPMPGAVDLLSILKNKNLPMGIVSNAQFYTPLTMEVLFQKDLAELGFDLSLCSWSYRLLKAKPSRDIFTDPLKKLEDRGIKPEEVLYVGNDMLNDIYTASLWGCKTALFAGDARSLRLRESDNRCRELEPTVVLTSLDELKELV